jgi:hypothetical protein
MPAHVHGPARKQAMRWIDNAFRRSPYSLDDLRAVARGSFSHHGFHPGWADRMIGVMSMLLTTPAWAQLRHCWEHPRHWIRRVS